MTPRLIARIDIKGGSVVKGVRLEGLRKIGSPAEFARRYYAQGADELLYLDIVASLYGRAPDLAAVQAATAGVSVPVCVGGGIRSVEHVRALLLAGADKVAVNTAAVLRPELLRELSDAFGASTVALSIESKWDAASGRYGVYTHGGRERHDLDAVEWAQQCAPYVAETLLTSIDHDGTMTGTDVRLLSQIASAVPVHVIASGGIAKPSHVAAALKHCDAVAVASAFHVGDWRVWKLKFETLLEHGIEFRHPGISSAQLAAMARGVLEERAREHMVAA